MTKRIVFEDPAPASRGKNGGNVLAFIDKLSETPDRWAVYARDAKYISYYYTIASKRKDVKVAIRRNGSGKTHTVYFMVLSEASVKTRIAEKAKRDTRKPVKKAKVVKTTRKSSV
jgi:hypothetical protein